MKTENELKFSQAKPPERAPGTRSLADIRMRHFKMPEHRWPDVQFELNNFVNLRGIPEGSLPNWIPFYRKENESDALLARRAGDTVAKLILDKLNISFPHKPASNRKRAERTGRRFTRWAKEQLAQKIPFTPRQINPNIEQEFREFIQVVD